MSKLTYPLPGGGTIEVDLPSSKTKDIFAKIAEFGEVFGHTKCGNEACGKPLSENGQLRTRSKDDYSFYEYVCTACNWRLQYGQRKDGEGLWPKGWEPPFQGGSGGGGGSNDYDKGEDPAKDDDPTAGMPF